MTGRVISIDGVEVIDIPSQDTGASSAESSVPHRSRVRPLVQILMFALRLLVVALRVVILAALAIGTALVMGLRRAQEGLAGFEARFNSERRDHDGSQTT